MGNPEIPEAASWSAHIESHRKRTTFHSGAKATYAQQEDDWYKLLKAERAKGKRISGLWITTTMLKLIKEQLGDSAVEGFCASRGWFNAFLNRHKLSLRARSNKKFCSIEERLPGVRKWHARLRRRVRRGVQRSTKWGRWLPHNRYIDQVPLTLQDSTDRIYDTTGSEHIWMRASKQGDDKREATLQLCVRLDNDAVQPKPVIIFRGKGLRITEKERAECDPRVIVSFQPKAWADREFCTWYAKDVFPRFVEKDEENVVFLDNLNTQTSPDVAATFKSAANAKVHFLKADCTGLIQPIDAGVGKKTKDVLKRQ